MGETSTDQVVSADRARELVAAGDATVLDIRDDEAWGEAHVPGALRADPDDLDRALADVGDEERLLVVCASGDRSREIAAQLREQGREAVSLEGGMEAWQAKGHGVQPTEPDVDFEFQGPGDKQPGV